jgi:hypothetical protein
VLGQGHRQDPPSPRQGGRRFPCVQHEGDTLTDHEIDYGILAGQVEDLGSELETLTNRVAHVQQVAELANAKAEQAQVRAERLEQALLALLEDPGNPHSAADRARAILTAIPVPQA